MDSGNLVNEVPKEEINSKRIGGIMKIINKGDEILYFKILRESK